MTCWCIHGLLQRQRQASASRGNRRRDRDMKTEAEAVNRENLGPLQMYVQRWRQIYTEIEVSEKLIAAIREIDIHTKQTQGKSQRFWEVVAVVKEAQRQKQSGWVWETLVCRYRCRNRGKCKQIWWTERQRNRCWAVVSVRWRSEEKAKDVQGVAESLWGAESEIGWKPRHCMLCTLFCQIAETVIEVIWTCKFLWP